MTSQHPALHTIAASPSLADPPSPSGLHRPTLKDVLHNLAPPPFSLHAFTHYLHTRHCPELLSFTRAISSYRAAHQALSTSLYQQLGGAGTILDSESQRLAETHALWRHLIDTYISTNAADQVNLQGRVREKLLREDRALERDGQPPEPAVLSEAEESMQELLGDVFAHFLDRVAAAAMPACAARLPARPQSLSAPSVVRGEVGCEGDRARSMERMRANNDPEGLGIEDQAGLRRANDVWGEKVYRNIHFCRDLAVKAGNLVRIASSDKLKGMKPRPEKEVVLECGMEGRSEKSGMERRGSLFSRR